MAEDRMLSDEILLGLINKNSGGGGGGTTNYNNLENKPQIGGVTLTGNKTASDLGLVAAEAGKGLSSNNYTNEDKAIVGGVTAALAGKQDKTDNSLQTTDKTVVGAINEHEGDISSLMSGLTNLDDEVNGDATTYPYADVITIEDAVPSNLAQCSVKIEPVQSGSGDPSPTNIRPIIGHTDVSVQRDGKNLFDKNNAGNLNGYALNSEIGVPYATASGWTTSSFIEIEPSTTYTLTTMSVNNSVAFYDGEKVYISGATSFGTKTTPSNAKYLRFDYKTENAGIMQLELGSAETPYVPYVEPKTYTITLGSTIYGGTLDVDSGVLTVDRVSVDMGTLPWGADGQNMFRANITGAKTYSRNILPPWKCEVYPTKAQDDTSGQCISSTNWTSAVCLWNSGYSDAASVATALSGKLLVYELATPTTIQLTPQQIQLLKGTNTLTASTGQISVTVNGVSGAIGSVQEQVNELAEEVAEIKPVDYSTTEQATGRKWLNKPTYIVVIDMGEEKTVTSNAWYTVGNHLGTETIVNGIGISGGGGTIPMQIVEDTNDGIKILQTRNAQVGVRYVWLEYTKTT